MDSAPRKRGCFFYGCLTLVLLLVLVGAAVGILLYISLQVTSEAPRPLPEFQLRPGQEEEVRRRVAEFERAGRAAGPVSLELTADDLNALITGDDWWRGKAHARIEGDRIIFDLALPLEKVPFVSDRYLNGSVAVQVRLRNGRLKLDAESGEVGGEPLRRDLLDAAARLLETNLNQELRRARFLEFLREARSLEVRDGKVIITR